MSRTRIRQAIALAAMAAMVTLSVSCGTAQPTSTFFTTDTLTGTVATGVPGVNPVTTTVTGAVNIGLLSLSPNSVQAGNYCLEVFESTPLPQPNTYSLKFSHH